MPYCPAQCPTESFPRCFGSLHPPRHPEVPQSPIQHGRRGRIQHRLVTSVFFLGIGPTPGAEESGSKAPGASYVPFHCIGATGRLARFPELERSTVAATCPFDGMTSRTPWKSVRVGRGIVPFELIQKAGPRDLWPVADPQKPFPSPRPCLPSRGVSPEESSPRHPDS